MTKQISADNHSEILVEAIDFFSQSLHLDQLIYYGFELVNKALKLKASALYIVEGDHFELKRHYLYVDPTPTIARTTQLNAIATLFGRILVSDYDKYFRREDVAPFAPDMIIPIIVKDELVGFIIAQKSEDFIYGDKEMTIAFAINQLMNKAYENARSFKALEEKNFELDKKIFNLFFINHCSRTLLSELQIDTIYQLCIDIIRELTASAVTTFFIYEPVTNQLVLKGYKNILDFSQYYGELKLKPLDPKTLKVVYHVTRDKDILQTIFEDLTEFERIKAEYIILIVKEKIVGLVTISESVSERAYDPTLFELIESVVTSIYISLTNALYFKAINEQKVVIQKKFEILTSLNRAIRNINQCVEINELFDVTVNTLKWGFDVKKVMILSADDEDYCVAACTEVDWLKAYIAIPEDTMNRIGNQVFFHHDVSVLKDLIPDLEDYAELDGNCVVIAPIVVDRMTLKGDYKILGFILVTELKDILQEEQVILVDSIANSIAPILDHMYEKATIEKQHIPNYEVLFMEALKEEIANKKRFDYSIYVQFRTSRLIPFQESQPVMDNNYPFKGYEFMITEESEVRAPFTHCIEVVSESDFLINFEKIINQGQLASTVVQG